MGKAKARLTLVFLLIFFALLINKVYATPIDFYDHYALNLLPATPPNIDSPSSILIESKRGQILFEKNSRERLHISAANKIMTTLVTIEKMQGELDSKVTISKESVDTEGANLKLVVGEKYSVEDLLYAVMLRSANDAANALAEYVGGDIESFVALMNDKALELNLHDTHFSNPSGLYDETQYTTAYDISLLIKYAIGNPIFDRIFSTKSRPWANNDGTFTILVNQNNLFWEYEGIDGGKTGFNNQDQHTAITTATRNGQRLISVVLDSPKDSVFVDSEKLLDYGFNNFRTGILVRKGEPLKSIQVGDKVINLVSINDVYYTYPIGDSYIKNYEVKVVENLEPPIKKSVSIGTARYILADGTIIDISLYPDVDINPPEDFTTIVKKKLMENKDILYLVVFLLAIEVILILYNIIKLIGKAFKRTSISEKK
ncbi:MAG TPA: D-alanyl-D-alanine carboxypeptidase [Clostridiaceae bacterium]|nr:D-alanyl-D-alanine carboxypeptidase [Clostridiaceae bacterium]